MNRLLARQIARVTSSSGEVDQAKLLLLVETAYEEADRERNRTDRAVLLMCEEMDHLNSELQRMVDTLEVQNGRFDAALENMCRGLSMFAPDGTLLIWNRRALNILGLPPRSVAAGMTIMELLRLMGYEETQAVGIAAEHTDAARRGERLSLDRRLSDGRTVTVRHEPLPDGGFLITHEDTTERSQAREAEKDARERAERADRAKSEFLANMSHELRTPLNAIIGFSEIMNQAMMGPIDARYQQYAADINDSGRHLLQVINDILDLSKIEAGKIELNESAVDVAETLDGCVRIIGPCATKANLRLETEFARPLPPLLADEARLRQIAFNLLSNAVKFTDPEGCVTIRAFVDRSGGVAIAVADSGIGMTADEIVVALRPFGRATSTRSRATEGTGLGLPLTKRLAEQHGGTLEIASVPGNGTTVTVTFPPARSLAPQADAQAAHPAPAAETV